MCSSKITRKSLRISSISLKATEVATPTQSNEELEVVAVVNSVEATRTTTITTITITDILMVVIRSKDSTETSITITTTTKVVLDQVEITTIQEATIIATATPIVANTATIVISRDETDHRNSNSNNHSRTIKVTMESSSMDKMVLGEGSSMRKRKPTIDHISA